MSKHTIASWPNRADIRHEKSDGSSCVHSLTWDQFAEFYGVAHEVRLSMLGYEQVQCRADELQPGDVFESLGSAVQIVNRMNNLVQVQCRDSKILYMGDSQLVRVNRAIQ